MPSTQLKHHLAKPIKFWEGLLPFIALAASYFDLKASVVSVVGDDFPQEYLDLLSSKNIDISGIEIIKVVKPSFGAESITMISTVGIPCQLNLMSWPILSL